MKVQITPKRRKPISPLLPPTFADIPLAALRLQARFGLSDHLALTICALAGIGEVRH